MANTDRKEKRNNPKLRKMAAMELLKIAKSLVAESVLTEKEIYERMKIILESRGYTVAHYSGGFSFAFQKTYPYGAGVVTFGIGRKIRDVFPIGVSVAADNDEPEYRKLNRVKFLVDFSNQAKRIKVKYKDEDMDEIISIVDELRKLKDEKSMI